MVVFEAGQHVNVRASVGTDGMTRVDASDAKQQYSQSTTGMGHGRYASSPLLGPAVTY